MHGCNGKRQEEHRQYLALDCIPHLILAHPNLLHNDVTLPILKTFGDLLVVDDQHCSHNEHEAEKEA